MAVVSVNWLPVICMPSPESPAKRITTSSCLMTSVVMMDTPVGLARPGLSEDGLHERNAGIKSPHFDEWYTRFHPVAKEEWTFSIARRDQRTPMNSNAKRPSHPGLQLEDAAQPGGGRDPGPTRRVGRLDSRASTWG